MGASVTVGVICCSSGDQAYDAMCLQRCLEALSQTDASPDFTVQVWGDDALGQLNELMAADPADVIVLMTADCVPQSGMLSHLLAETMSSHDSTQVFSPQVQGVLDWPPLPDNWSPAVGSRLSREVVRFQTTDWPRLRPPAGTSGSCLIDAIVDAAERHHIVDEAQARSFRPTTLAHHLMRLIPRFDIRRCGGLVISTASVDAKVGTAALTAWIALSACDLQLARSSLLQWHERRAQLTPKARSRLPRWMTHCDQHAESIIHEGLLTPGVADQCREAVAHADPESARQLLAQHPDVYCAAVAVMAMAPQDVRSIEPSHIPKVIVQGWFDSDLPVDSRCLVDKWATLHPTWQHRFFNTASAEAWLSDHVESDLVATFRRATPVAKSNLFRYAYLSVEGGVWSDVDDRPLQNINHLVADRGLVVLRESNGAIGDNFIAVKRGHPVLIAARDEAFLNERDGYTELQWLANGPGMFTRKMANWLVSVSNEADLDYHVVPGTTMVNYISVHENLDYKAGTTAWDSLTHRIPEGSLLVGNRVKPRSGRQQALLTSGTTR